MLTLGIETSCDETSCAVLSGKNRILSNVISSSLFRHKEFGGVVPEIASRHSLEQIDTVFKEAVREANVKVKDLDLVAVTYGPGLIGSLFVGVCFAKALSYRLKLPIVGVNHLEAHLAANFIGKKMPKDFIGLLVSGGHTSLSLHRDSKVKILGQTVDDAVGEAFDKVAKMLGLGYPGGPVIEKMALEGDPKAFRFTKPKQKNKFDFSLSGIKTAVLYTVRKKKSLSRQFVRDMSRCFQDAVVSWILDKSIEAAREKKIKNIAAGGGVCANNYLRESLTQKGKQLGIHVWFPERALTLDNAAMIARRGIELFESGKRDGLSLTANPNLKLN